MQHTRAVNTARLHNSAEASGQGKTANLSGLWKRFGDASTFEAFAEAWLSLQCSMVEAALQGVVVLAEPGGRALVPVAYWPSGSTEISDLTRIAESAVAERRGVVKGYSDSNDPDSEAQPYCEVAFPLLIDGRVCGVVALIVTTRSDAELRVLMRQLQWGSGWLETLMRRQEKIDAGVERLGLVLQLVTVCLEHQKFQASATALATELAVIMNCDRVTLSTRVDKHTRVVAMSHSANVGAGSNLLRAITLAMDEALDQYCGIVYPGSPQKSLVVSKAHQDLASLGGSETSVCTVLLTDVDELVGAITCERFKGPPFDKSSFALSQHVANFVGPILEIKRLEDRPLVNKAAVSFKYQAGKLISHGHYGFKTIAAGLTGLIVFFSFATAAYRVNGDAALEGVVQRVIAAPIEGYIAESVVRPGDIVKQGQPVLTIDDRDLRLQYLRWSGQKEQVRSQYRDALAQHDRSSLNILQAQLEQADAQLELLKEQIARTRIVAPFDGVIVTGDLSQELGAPVQRGQVLMEIAPLNAYRVAINIDERDIADLKIGQHGELILAAVPHMYFGIQVKSITPVSVIEEGRNTFRVEAELTGGADILRPGMRGTAKIDIDRRRLIWIWTHRLTDWLRLWSWSWL